MTAQALVGGRWVVAIPLAYRLLFRHRCGCGRKFWTEAGYQGHWLLEHQWRGRGYLVGDMQTWDYQ